MIFLIAFEDIIAITAIINVLLLKFVWNMLNIKV